MIPKKDRIKTKLEYDFEKFNKEYPECYELFKKFTFEAIQKGRTQIGVALIIERIRWETTVAVTGAEFKINNNHRAYFSRRFIEEFPQYSDIFRTRVVYGDKLANVVGTML